jgi:addiction module HigA family antidote
MGNAGKVWTVHPGEILKTEFLEPMGITAYRLAKDLDSPGIYEVLRGRRAISADIALRLGKYFEMPAQFWMNLQAEHDLRLAAAVADLDKVKPRAA